MFYLFICLFIYLFIKIEYLMCYIVLDKPDVQMNKLLHVNIRGGYSLEVPHEGVGEGREGFFSAK